MTFWWTMHAGYRLHVWNTLLFRPHIFSFIFAWFSFLPSPSHIFLPSLTFTYSPFPHLQIFSLLSPSHILISSLTFLYSPLLTHFHIFFSLPSLSHILILPSPSHILLPSVTFTYSPPFLHLHIFSFLPSPSHILIPSLRCTYILIHSLTFTYSPSFPHLHL